MTDGTPGSPPPPKPPRLWLIILALVYILSPIDLIPEIFLPFLGWMDDCGALLVLIRELLKRRHQCTPSAPAAPEAPKPVGTSPPP